MKPTRLWWSISILVLLSLAGCSATLQQAQQQEKQGQLEQAEQSYSQIAKQEGTEDARLAQMAIIRLLVKREQWKRLSGEASRLASFLESDDPWYRQYRANETLWKQAQHSIAALLLYGARISLQKARSLGDPDAYIASGRLYGLYIERFKQGTAIAEAAAGRGVAFASRSDCREALPWFQRAMEWSPGLQALQKQMSESSIQLGQPDSHPWLVWQAIRGELACRVQLWLESRQSDPASNRTHTSSATNPSFAFVRVEQSARSFVHRDPVLGGSDLLHQSSLLERSGAYLASMKLLLILAEDTRIPALQNNAKQRILQIFGQSKQWKPLLFLLQQKLAQIPPTQQDLFWRRVQELGNLFQMRKAQVMAQQQQGRSAVQQLLQEYQGAPQQRQILLFRAALMTETDLRDVAGALGLYQKFLDAHVQDPLAMKVLYRMALLWERQKNPQKAIQFYLRLGGAYPKHPIAPRAFYQCFVLYQQLGQPRKAWAMRRHILRRYPTSLAARRLVSMKRKRRRRRRSKRFSSE